MHFRILTGLMAATLVAGASPAAASTITYAGSLIDFGGGWRTASVSKGGLDLAGTGVLGVDGYYVPGGQGSSAIPTYASDVYTVGNVFPGNGGYIAIDNPTTTPGPAPSTIVTGTFNPFPGGGAYQTDFSFTAAGVVPNVIRIGLMEDNLDISGYNGVEVGVSSSLGASAVVPGGTFTAPDQFNRIPDWYFFDITGATSGETFSINVQGGPNGCACLGAVSFDSAASVGGGVPEPADWALVLTGFTLVGAAIRRRRLDLEIF